MSADDEALVKIRIRLAVAQSYKLAVFIVLVPVEILAEALLGAGNGHIAVMAVYGLAFEAGHGVFVDKSHTALEGLEVGLARGQLSRAGG